MRRPSGASAKHERAYNGIANILSHYSAHCQNRPNSSHFESIDPNSAMAVDQAAKEIWNCVAVDCPVFPVCHNTDTIITKSVLIITTIIERVDKK